jgi:hypothetical protein
LKECSGSKQFAKKNEAIDDGHGSVETRTCEVISDLTLMDESGNGLWLKSYLSCGSRKLVQLPKK